MKASKLLKFVGVGMVFSSFLFACSHKDSDVKTIGVLQYMEHGALDAAYEGFIVGLAEKGYIEGENIKIDLKNAHGDLTTAQTIANQYVSDDVDMMFAIATQAVQSAYNATKEIPILMTAVTDPVEAGVVKDWNQSGTNVTGTSDLTPVAKQMELITELVPEAKTVGVIYTTSEVNSEVQVKMAEEAASNLGLQVIRVGVTTVNDIPQAVASVIDKVDAMYAPTDNLIASSMPVLWNVCLDKKVPIVAGVDTMVIDGGIATEGIDYYQLGYETGLMAAQVLEGKDPSTMPINTLQNTTLIVNQKNAEAIGLSIPDSILKGAEIIGGEKDGSFINSLRARTHFWDLGSRCLFDL